MKWLFAKHDSAIYTALRRTLVIQVIVSIACAALVSYYFNRQSVLDTAWENDERLLEMHVSMMSRMEELGFSIGHQIYADNQIACLLYGDNHTPREKYIASLALNNYRTCIPYIESIYVYNGTSRTMTISSTHSGGVDIPIDSAPEMFKPLITGILSNATVMDLVSPYPNLIRYDASYKPERLCYTFVVSDIYGDENIRQAVFINFSARWMQQVLLEQNSSQSETLMLNADGLVMFSTREARILQSVADTELFSRILASDQQPRMACAVDGRKMLVTIRPQNREGWYCVRLTPYDVVLADSNRVLGLMLLIDGAMLLLYVLMSLVVSKRIYVPIDSMSRELTVAQDNQKKLENTNQQKRMLRKLLLDASGSDQHETLVQEVGQSDEEMCAAQSYYVLVLRIDKYNRFCNAYPLHERAERMQRLIQIATDELAPEFGERPFSTLRTLELGEGSNIVFVLTRESGEEIPRDDWQDWISRIRARVMGELSLKFSCALSVQGSQLSDLSTLYHQAYNAMKYRIFHEGNANLFTQDVPVYGDQPYAYPEATESRMLSSMMNGDAEQAKDAAREILNGVTESPFVAIQLTISRLTMSLMLAMQKTELGSYEFPPKIRETLLTASSLDEIDSYETTVEYFCTAIEQMCETLHSKHDTRYAELAEKINALIGQTYMNPECSLTYVAEQFNLSTAHITRLYRSYTLQTIPDHINEVRMAAARKLLKENLALNITEISKLVGYSSSSYFAKAFRKEHGVTPNEYRNYTG